MSWHSHYFCVFLGPIGCPFSAPRNFSPIRHAKKKVKSTKKARQQQIFVPNKKINTFLISSHNKSQNCITS